VTCTDAISRTLNTLPPAQLLDILQQMKTLATSDPARATELLAQAPQLSYAVFQALLIMGLVTPEAITSVLEPPTAATAAAATAAGGVGMGLGVGVGTGTPPVVAPVAGAAAGGYAPPLSAAAPAPVPVPPAPAAAQAPPPVAQDPEALMRAVMELPQETIDQLPETERQQIMALRASYAAQTRR
jgi:cleavage stimulation factor subunit 2